MKESSTNLWIYVLILFILLMACFSVGCKAGLTRDETLTVFKAWNYRSQELNKAKEAKLFTETYIKSMDTRDEEVEKLLREGIK